MPEGDAVWLTARRLHNALAGSTLTRCDLRVPRHATVDLRGHAVIEAVARGKHILIRVEGGVTVHSHLRMDGSWRIVAAGRRTSLDHDPQVRVVLGNAEWQAFGRALGLVEVLATTREHLVVGTLGPDLLGPDWDPAEAVRRLLLAPGRPVGEALLDQTALAGIGNVYKAEVLFLRGVHPWRPVGEVADLDGLVRLARRLLDANRERHGQVTTGDRRPGREHWVYGRAGRPCRRCGTRIKRARQGAAAPTGRPYEAGSGPDPQERVTFWCPRCQPADPTGA